MAFRGEKTVALGHVCFVNGFVSIHITAANWRALPLMMAILGDPGAVSRVDKMFVVNVYCKIETSSSRSYSKLSPRTFYRPD